MQWLLWVWICMISKKDNLIIAIKILPVYTLFHWTTPYMGFFFPANILETVWNDTRVFTADERMENRKKKKNLRTMEYIGTSSMTQNSMQLLEKLRIPWTDMVALQNLLPSQKSKKQNSTSGMCGWNCWGLTHPFPFYPGQTCRLHFLPCHVGPYDWVPANQMWTEVIGIPSKPFP